MHKQALMTDFSLAVSHWGQADFEAVLLGLLSTTDTNTLPLQQALRHSSMSTDQGISFMVLSRTADKHAIHVKLGLFFQGVIAGCNCADDPSPVEGQTEYCELLLSITKANGQAAVRLLG